MTNTTVSIFTDFNIQDWTNPDKVIAYVKTTDPAVLAPIALWLLTIIFVRKSPAAKITLGDRLLGWWLLFNGFLIHMFLDGLV